MENMKKPTLKELLTSGKHKPFFRMTKEERKEFMREMHEKHKEMMKPKAEGSDIDNQLNKLNEELAKQFELGKPAIKPEEEK